MLIPLLNNLQSPPPSISEAGAIPPLPSPSEVFRMTDLALELDEFGADLILEGGDLKIDSGLGAPMLVSLFSDRRARPDQNLPGELDDLRGWWAEDAGEGFGSLLWLLSRAKATDASVERAREFTATALAWLVELGVVAAMDVQALKTNTGRIVVTVQLTRGPSPRWPAIWAAIEETTFSANGVEVQLVTA